MIATATWISRTLVVLVALVSAHDISASTADQRDVVAIATAYADGGGYRKDWKGSGTPEAIEFAGTRILTAGQGGTYCSGFTFAVAMRAAAARGLLAEKKPAELTVFQKHWYGAVPIAAERQCVEAMERLGIGKAVALEDAQPGDFVQIWRVSEKGKTSGHSVVLLRLVREDGQIAGLEYRSSQAGTKGIGNRIERFSDAASDPGKMDRARTYAGRLAAVPAPGD
jgi:hypothetical protein